MSWMDCHALRRGAGTYVLGQLDVLLVAVPEVAGAADAVVVHDLARPQLGPLCLDHRPCHDDTVNPWAAQAALPYIFATWAPPPRHR